MHRGQVQRRVFEAFATLMAEHSFDAITMAKTRGRGGHRAHGDLAPLRRQGCGGHRVRLLSQDAIGAIREHAVAIEDVLREILTDAATAGQFTVEGGDRAVCPACPGGNTVGRDIRSF